MYLFFGVDTDRYVAIRLLRPSESIDLELRRAWQRVTDILPVSITAYV
jgi:hypothetical protein